MTHDDIARAMAVEINQSETNLAAAAARLAEANNLATDEFRGLFPAETIETLEDRHAKAVKALSQAKRALNLLHGSLNKVIQEASNPITPSPRAGGK